MPFVVSPAASIRDQALENWRARYRLRGVELDVSEGSDAYNEMDAIALEVEILGLAAAEAAHRVLLRYATGQDLDDFATDDGIERRAPTFARRVVRVEGAPSTTTGTRGATLGATTGLAFVPINPDTGAPLTAIITNAAGTADIVCQCSEPGSVGNLVTGALLTWSTAPVAFSPLGVVVAQPGSREGLARESDDALRKRLIERRRERPGSGNRADWRDWGRAVDGVAECFAYGCTRPPQPPPAPYLEQQIQPETPGCVLLIPVPPSPPADSYVQNADGSLGLGLDIGYSRVPQQWLCDAVNNYINGTHNADGTRRAPSEERQLYPAVIMREDWGAIVPPTVMRFDVLVRLKVTNDAAFAFDGTRTITAVTDVQHITLSSGAGLSSGDKLAILYPENAAARRTVIRGGWALAEIDIISGANVTLKAPLPARPPVGALVRADSGVWNAARAALLGHFDSMGPGSHPNDLSRSTRFPPSSWGAGCTIIPTRILTALLAIPDVVDVELVSPATRQELEIGVMVEPNTVTIERLP